jgi:DNA polymerase-3 subunit alpha
VHHLGGVPLRAAYSLIKAISKKKIDEINKVREAFVRGAGEKGLAAAKAEELFELILKFAGYGFNKSHSTGYAIIAYQTAYLKTYFPAHYMSAVLSFESQARKIEEWSVYLDDCRRLVYPDHDARKPHIGVEVRPPDVNLSEEDFAVVYAPGEKRSAWGGHIRFGLKAIKGIGAGAMRAVIEERRKGGPFKSVFDFCERVDSKLVNRAGIEGLVKAGCFDTLHGAENRASVTASIESAISAGQSLARDKAGGQENFFGMFEAAAPKVSAAATPAASLRKVAPWDRMEALRFEKEALGFHVSGHPLDGWREQIKAFCTADVRRLMDLPQDTPCVVAGLVARSRIVVTQKGKNPGSKMMILGLADKNATMDAVLFTDAFAKFGDLIVNDKPVVLIGSVDRNRGEPNIIVERVIALEDAERHLGTLLEVSVECGGELETAANGTVEMLAGLLKQATNSAALAQGKSVDVMVHLETDARRVTLQSHRLRVVPDRSLLEALRGLVGADRVKVRGGWAPERRKPKQWGARRPSEETVEA